MMQTLIRISTSFEIHLIKLMETWILNTILAKSENEIVVKLEFPKCHTLKMDNDFD